MWSAPATASQFPRYTRPFPATWDPTSNFTLAIDPDKGIVYVIGAFIAATANPTTFVTSIPAPYVPERTTILAGLRRPAGTTTVQTIGINAVRLNANSAEFTPFGSPIAAGDTIFFSGAYLTAL